jgi:hypothetical protein
MIEQAQNAPQLEMVRKNDAAAVSIPDIAPTAENQFRGLQYFATAPAKCICQSLQGSAEVHG